MKKHKNLLRAAIIMIVAFVGISIFTFFKSNDLIEQGYLASEGSKAMDFAVLASSYLQLSDARVEELKSYTYEEMLESPENKMLYEKMSNDNFSSVVDYAYLMVHLDENEVKYNVNEDNKKSFDAPLGTSLDILWLLDASMLEAYQTKAEDGTFDVLERYSYYVDEDDEILGDKPTYTFYASEWGDHICGYAPVYSTEGTYIGALGVDLETSDYKGYRLTAMWAMGLLLLVSTVCLILVFCVLYLKYRKIQHDRIYTDALTKISNRSYYNDQLIKKMNAEFRHAPHFALLIADIDWFKKVNDTFGHEIGDQVLLELGEILLEFFGKTHVCRFGGEEFVVALWIEDTEVLGEKIAELFEKVRNHLFSSQQIEVTISLGCSYYENPERLSGWLLSGMLKAADCKLYDVKEQGRNNYRIVEYDPAVEYKKGASCKISIS